VTIPAGVDNRKQLVIPKQGNAGKNNGPPGDLIVVIHVAPHRCFERDGVNLYCAVSISMAQAALGAELTIRGLDEKNLKLKIPAGVQHGKMLCVKGEGVPVQGSSRKGDLFLKILINIPEKLSQRQRQLLSEFLSLEGTTDNPEIIPLSSLR
jgi:molecular chaperone DnaJ